MRVRDTKLYIFITFLVFSMAAIFNIFYIASFTNRIREMSYNSATNDTMVSLIKVSERILYYEKELENDRYDNIELINNPKRDFLDMFTYENYGSYMTAVLNAKDIEQDNAIDKYFLYIYFDDKLAKVELEKIFEPISDCPFYLFKGIDGQYVYSKLTFDHFFTFIDDDGTTDFSDIKEDINNHSSFARFVNIEGERKIAAGVSFGKDYYFCQFFDVNTYKSKINGVMVMGVILVVVMAISVLIIVVIAILSVKKQNKLIVISKRAARRSDAIIIRAKKDGKIFEINHNIHNLAGKKYKNIYDFKTISNESFKDLMKNQDKIIAKFEENGEITYIDFTIFKYNYTFYLVGRDVTNDHINNERLKELTSLNSVTKLPNYFALVGDYSKIIKQNLNKVTTFLLFDVVEHEEISSVFGTSTYYEMLVEASNRVKKIIGENILYHLENNLFLAVITSSVKDGNEKKIGDIISALKKTIDIKNNTLYVKYKYSSYDLVNASKSNVDLDEIMDVLKVTLDVAEKSINRDYIKYDATIQNMINHRKQMQIDLVKALDNGEFMMYFQPQYDVLENRIAGFESLIRWNNPKYINISPQEYIELAEKNGLIIEIGNFIIKEVFKTAKLFEPYDVALSINVSPAQLLQAGFVGFLLEEFEKNQLKPKSIAVEITETFLMENFNVVIEKLNILRNHGFSIHLDDFGTGYSSLQYLKELPIDTIKTDKEFIKNLESDKTSQLIVKGIIGMAKSINLEVISEGVETRTQAEILKKAGTNYFQGWLISKAVPLDKALDMAKNGIELQTKGK